MRHRDGEHGCIRGLRRCIDANDDRLPRHVQATTLASGRFRHLTIRHSKYHCGTAVRRYDTAMAKQSRREVAEGVLEITLLVTGLVTPEVGRLRAKQLSLSHMRALGFLDANPDADLSAIADYVGLTLPSMSTLVDGLVRRGLVVRLAAPRDRRRLRLRLTGAGRAALRSALAAAPAVLGTRVAALSPGERALLPRAMTPLPPVLSRERESGG